MPVRSAPSASVSKRDLERAMAGTPLMESLPSRAVADFAALGVIREYRRGTYLFFQDDDADTVLFLCRGRIEVSSLSVTGHRQLLTTLEPPQFFGELGVLGNARRTSTAMALEDAAVWVVRGEAFVRFLADHFEAARALLGSLARQIQAHESFVEDLLYLGLKGRVAKRLLQLVSPSLTELPPDGTVVPSAVTHSDLASLVGGSRENVTRILSDFQRRRLVRRDGKRYVLTNVAGLRRLASV
jgi:CRP/FNR family transcriptional regulator, cyclic AMP receptor protein